jgi:orotidine-5'-phosphate decarboxylase
MDNSKIRPSYSTSTTDRVIVALDVKTATQARSLIEDLPGVDRIYKIGPHFIFDPMMGVELLDRDFRAIGRTNPSWFVDLKHLDTETTVEMAIRHVANRTNYLTGQRQFVMATVHAHMSLMRAAVYAAQGTQLKILAVPLLTSFGPDELHEFYNDARPPLDFVIERVNRAIESGCDGVICSAEEVGHLRTRVPPGFLLVVPGISVDNDAPGHKRTGTAAQAIRDGADHIVVGRSIVTDKNPVAAYNRIVQECGAHRN